jgi:hypothetical protein
MTWSNYQRVVIHYYKQEAKEWDMTRVLASLILNTNVSRQHQKTPMQLIPLWIDKFGRKRKGITEADRDRILASLKRTEENERGINSIPIG